MAAKIEYKFSGKIWKDKFNKWHFISLPKDQSVEIRANLQWQEEGWGRMKAIAKINDCQWNTSIWFDSKLKVYVLPLKSEIRNKLKLTVGDMLEVEILV